MAAPQPADIILLISPDRKRFVLRLQSGAALHTHCGVIPHDAILETPYGGSVLSHTGHPFTVLQPTMEEALMSLRRATQIVYPKEIGYILLKLSILPGRRVIEAGAGSGVLTAALARYVQPGGSVYSYEVRLDMLELARENVSRLGLIASVEFRHRSIEDGFLEHDVDAVFLDLREPWRHLDAVSQALANGGFFGSVVPTVNQVIELVNGLQRRSDFTDVEVLELLLRQYKPIAERLRPMDRLTAHTGFLTFARKLEGSSDRGGGAASRRAAGAGSRPLDRYSQTC